MRVWDYYFNEMEKIKNISIDDNSDDQKIQYVNRLVGNPIILNRGGTMSMEGIGNPGVFTGKAENEKLAMCGVNGDWSPQSAIARGLIGEFSVPCPPGKIKFNKYAINDLVAILNEIKQQVPWYDLYISSHFRETLSAGGHSRHQVGLAIDINAGGRGNPWFATRIPKGRVEPPAGITPPWPMKSCPYHGTYDRKRCIWHWDHPVVKIFETHGWGWGGLYGDVMHFSIDGK